MAAGKPGRPPRNGPDEADDIERLLSSAGANDVIQFFRRDAAAGKWVYLEQLEPSQLRADGIREFASRRYGGGDIKVRLRDRTSGEYGMTRTIALAGAPKPFNRDAPINAIDTAAASSSSSAAAPADSTRSVAERVALAMAIPFATAAGGYLAKMLLEGRKPDPLLEQLVKSLAGGGGKKGDDPHEVLRMIQEAEERGERRGITIGELRASLDSAGDSQLEGWGAVLTQALGPIESVANRYLDIEEKRLQRVAPRTPLALVPNAESSSSSSSTTPAAASSSSSATAPAGIDTNDPLVQVLGQIPIPARRFLLAAAADGEEPAVYAPLILTKLPDDTYRVMASMIDRADFLETMIAVVPKWGQYREWFAQLLEELRGAIHASTAENASETDPPAGAPAA